MESGLSLYNITCIIASFLAVSMGGFLIIIKSKPNRANVFLGLLLFVYSLFFLPGLFENLGILDDLPHIIRLNFFAGTLVGPLTYLYCKTSIHQETLAFKKYSFHFIPFLFSFYWFWPTLIKSGPEKLEIYQTTITQGKVPESQFAILGMVIIALIYTFVSIRMASKYLKHIQNTRSNIDPSFYRWLLFLSCSLVFPILVVAIITSTSPRVVSVLASIITLASFVLIVYITLTVRPKFFHHVPNQIKENETPEEVKSKYQNSNLQEGQKDKYLEKLIDYMESKKPFLDPELFITEFSEQVNIPSYYVSQLINEKLEVNFLDFVNGYRIDEVKSKLADSKLNHYTIITLAYESGFNSKTAFYSAFKKHVGSTPSQFRKMEQKGELV